MFRLKSQPNTLHSDEREYWLGAGKSHLLVSWFPLSGDEAEILHFHCFGRQRSSISGSKTFTNAEGVYLWFTMLCGFLAFGKFSWKLLIQWELFKFMLSLFCVEFQAVPSQHGTLGIQLHMRMCPCKHLGEAGTQIIGTYQPSLTETLGGQKLLQYQQSEYW